MTNALDLALANAAANAPKGEELHLENLDSIADPTIDEPQSIMHHTLLAADEIMSGWNELHSPKRRIQEQPHLIAYNDPQQDGLLLVNIKTVAAKVDLINSRLDALADMITEVSTTIAKAAQSMPDSTDLKHRSLHEWDDQYLINELVKRENDLMPFYYELLKRIGSPELQSLVMSSMQGKNASMVTLAQLCSALAPKPAQPQPISGNTILIPNNPVREKQKQAEALLNQNMLSEEQQNALSDEDYHNWAVYMNHLCEESTVMMRFPLTRNYEPIKWNRESVIPPQQVPPQQQYFGQATEEYIRQTNNRIGS